MSNGVNYLHSHSGLERTLPKDKELSSKAYVLVDEKFASMFADVAAQTKKFVYDGVSYIKVPTLVFVAKGGLFKNLSA